MPSSYLPVPAAPVTIEATEEGLQLDYGKLFRKYILSAILLITLGAAAGFLSVALMTPEFKARALIEVQSANGGILKLQGIPGISGDPSGQVDLITESQILQSKTFLRKLVERLQLETPSPAPVQSDIFSKLRRLLRGKQFEEGSVSLSMVGLEGVSTGTVPKALATALRSLTANPIDRTHLIELTCESPNPQFAADFLNALMDEYIQYNYQARMDAVRLTTQWITGQLAEAKTRMTEADARLQEFTRSSGDLSVAAEDTLASAKMKDLQGRLAAANSDLIAKQATYEMVHKTPAEALPNIVDDPIVRQYQTRIADLQREEATLITTLTPEHPKVKNVRAQIANLQATQQKELSAAVKRIDSQYEAAKRDQELLRNSYAAVAGQVGRQTGKQTQYDILKKEADSTRESYQALVLQANQASIAGSLPVNNIQAIDRAVPAEKAYKPKPFVNIGAGAAAGLAVCFGIAFLREKMDKRVNSPKQARRLFNLPQLGVIPSVGEKGTSPNLLLGLAQDRSAPPVNPLVAESFRLTLASLMRETAGALPPQVILVTSPCPEEGKTTIASNLGMSLAETGRSVLLVDADFRRPRAHKLFGIPNTKGLADLMSGESPVRSYGREALGVATLVPNLMVLPNGSQTQNISPILYSPRLRELVQRMRQEFDMVLIDAPPILNLADARVISEMADGVVLVIRVGVTNKSSVEEALEQLRSDRTVVLGTVLNDWTPTKVEAKNLYYYSQFDSPA